MINVAKKRTQALLDLRSQYESRDTRHGIGYYAPSNVPKAQWKQLVKKWNRILREDATFSDIEQFSSDCTGHFSPFFFKNSNSKSLSGSAATVARLYKPETAEYYRRLSLFFYHADLRSLLPAGALFWVYWHITRMRKDGATYDNIRAFFNSKKCPASIKKLKKRFTIFFVYYHVQRLEPIVAKWCKDNPRMIE